MSALAHVFEAAGLPTIVLASMKEVAERMMPPRTLYCEFPLGRPLGRPDDVELQLDVLNRALALLDSNEPVLETHPLVIESEETPMACGRSLVLHRDRSRQDLDGGAHTTEGAGRTVPVLVLHGPRPPLA